MLGISGLTLLFILPFASADSADEYALPQPIYEYEVWRPEIKLLDPKRSPIPAWHARITVYDNGEVVEFKNLPDIVKIKKSRGISDLAMDEIKHIAKRVSEEPELRTRHLSYVSQPYGDTNMPYSSRRDRSDFFISILKVRHTDGKWYLIRLVQPEDLYFDRVDFSPNDHARQYLNSLLQPFNWLDKLGDNFPNKTEVRMDSQVENKPSDIKNGLKTKRGFLPPALWPEIDCSKILSKFRLD